MIDSEFTAMMPHTIYGRHVLTRDGYGRPATYSAIVAYRGRVVSKRRKVINLKGSEVISETTVYLDTTAGVLIDDEITLPSGCYPMRPPIINICRYPDENGNYYTELYA